MALPGMTAGPWPPTCPHVGCFSRARRASLHLPAAWAWAVALGPLSCGVNPPLGAALRTLMNQPALRLGPPRIRATLGLAVLGLLVSAHAMAQSSAGQTPGVTLDARLARAQADPRLAEPLLKTGRKVAAFCANCHGDNGNSTKPDVPNLAGQNTAYLLEQLRQFADGRRRNEFMQGMIKAMSADETVGAALFFAAQTVAPRPAPPREVAARGSDVYQKNCFRCHGEAGLGNDRIARIAGQPPEYLTLSLKRYRSADGQRTDPLMAANTKLLTDAQIDAVAAYVSALR